jgi:hypothetical protein
VRSVRGISPRAVQSDAKWSRPRDKRCHNESGGELAVRKQVNEAAYIYTRLPPKKMERR